MRACRADLHGTRNDACRPPVNGDDPNTFLSLSKTSPELLASLWDIDSPVVAGAGSACWETGRLGYGSWSAQDNDARVQTSLSLVGSTSACKKVFLPDPSLGRQIFAAVENGRRASMTWQRLRTNLSSTEKPATPPHAPQGLTKESNQFLATWTVCDTVKRYLPWVVATAA